MDAVIEAFEFLHPGMTGVFVFDNSLNHKKAPEDGLDADRLPRKDGGKNVKRNVRDGWWVDDEGVHHSQKMQKPDGTPKGLDSILLERGLIVDGEQLKASCQERKKCSKKLTRGK